VLERSGRVGTAFALSGYKQAFLILFVCGLISFLACLFLKETLVRE
jgi:hypothetical protein